jgi:hypothetical protein
MEGQVICTAAGCHCRIEYGGDPRDARRNLLQQYKFDAGRCGLRLLDRVAIDHDRSRFAVAA